MRPLAVDLLHELIQHTLQVTERDPLVHHKTFHLAEHGRMRRVIIRPEDLARRQDLDGRLLLLHHVDLPRRGLRPQQILRRQIEGILHIPGRMIHGRIQRREVIIIILDLRSLEDLKSHPGKNIHHLVAHLCNGMKLAAPDLLAGNRHVDLLPLITPGQLRCPRLLFHLRETLQHPVLERVHALAELRLLLLGDAPHLLHQRVDLADLPVQIRLAQLINTLRIAPALRLLQKLLTDLLKSAQPCHLPFLWSLPAACCAAVTRAARGRRLRSRVFLVRGRRLLASQIKNVPCLLT